MRTSAPAIIAVASPPGAARRGIVRASGARAPELLAGHLRSGTKAWKRGIECDALVGLRGFDSVPDPLPCVVLRMAEGASYTGEPSFEIALPGAPWLLEAVVDALVASGRARGIEVERAGPGAFSARAWLSGRLSLDAAEAVAATIAAEDDAALAAARAVAGGAFGRAVAAAMQSIAGTLGLVEAGLDFADEEDVVAIRAVDLAAAVSAHLESVRRLARPGEAAGAAIDGRPTVMLVGRPNAGKSTLANALAAGGASESAAAAAAAPAPAIVTSSVAGTTRDVLEVEIDLAADVPGSAIDSGLDGHAPMRVRLLDSAGLGGTATDELDALGRSRAVEAAATADLLVHCVPADAPVEPLSALVGSGVAAGGGAGTGRRGVVPSILVRTRVDERPPDLPAVDHARGDAWVSAVRGDGLADVRTAIAAAVGRLEGRTGGWASVVPRHRAALAGAVAALREAAEMAAIDAEVAPPGGGAPSAEFIGSLLRVSLDELGAIGGAMSPDDVLDFVFGQFCIGK